MGENEVVIGFKAGDRVRQTTSLRSGENPEAVVIRVKGNSVWHKHIGSERICTAWVPQFELIESFEAPPTKKISLGEKLRDGLSVRIPESECPFPDGAFIRLTADGKQTPFSPSIKKGMVAQVIDSCTVKFLSAYSDELSTDIPQMVTDWAEVSFDVVDITTIPKKREFEVEDIVLVTGRADLKDLTGDDLEAICMDNGLSRRDVSVDRLPQHTLCRIAGKVKHKGHTFYLLSIDDSGQAHITAGGIVLAKKEVIKSYVDGRATMAFDAIRDIYWLNGIKLLGSDWKQFLKMMEIEGGCYARKKGTGRKWWTESGAESERTAGRETAPAGEPASEEGNELPF